ncbi:bifunctional lysylphosphatidylglycerol flippase/synthetase MprF [Tessaracoccus sp.]
MRRGSAALTVLLALVTVASALSRPLRARLEVLLEVMPFAALHVAAATTIFVGFAIAMTARGLLHGHRIAWAAAVALLLVAVVLNLVKGLDVEEGVISAGLVGWLLLGQRAYSVLPTRGQVRRALFVAVGSSGFVVIVSTVLVLTLGRRHHPRASETFQAAAERLGGYSQLPLVGLGPVGAPLLAAAGIAVVTVALWFLLSPRQTPTRAPADHVIDRERARAIVLRWGGGTLDYFSLRDDKEWFFSGDAVVSYAVRGGVCLVAPDPVGPREDRYQSWADFMDFTATRGWTVVVVGAAEDWREVYGHSGLKSMYLGDEAIVDVTTFTLTGRAFKGLRQAVNRVERAGVKAEFIDPATAPQDVRDKVLAIADKSRQGEAERGFSMTLSRMFDPADTGLLMVMATDATGRVLGFIQWVPAADLPGWSLDVMRRDTAEDVPNGLTDFMIVKTIEHIAGDRARGLGLNFAVMRDAMTTPPEGVAGQMKRRVLDIVAKHSQLESLGRFNEKYDPVWVARYVMHGSGDELVKQGLAVAQVEGVIDVPGMGARP